MHILNLVDSVDNINYGIWNTVTTLFPYLEKKGCDPEIWFPNDSTIPDSVKEVPWKSIKDTKAFEAALSDYSNKETIVISHGLWREPTFWGALAAKKGFSWVVIPHGMLEPWSMKHKWWKKLPYYNLIEKQKISQASAFIAVGLTEYYNLLRYFHDKVHLLSNGIKPISHPEVYNLKSSSAAYKFIFMSRLHHKKGVQQLLEGWLNSRAYEFGAQLSIIGPDEGELQHLQKMLTERSSNINTLTVDIPGPAYGSDKEKLLKEADFFILPSFSEGFPTAVLEAMSYGCYPILTDGCNFPQAFEQDVAVKILPRPDSITKVINNLFQLSPTELKQRSKEAKFFVDDNFSLSNLSDNVYDFYAELIEDKAH